MATAPISPLQQYLQSGYSASSGVDAALLNATAGNLPTNAINEQLQNLQLPADSSLFAPQDSEDYMPLVEGPITATATSPAAAFSLFGLDPVSSGIIVLAGAYLLFGSHRGRH